MSPFSFILKPSCVCYYCSQVVIVTCYLSLLTIYQNALSSNVKIKRILNNFHIYLKYTVSVPCHNCIKDSPKMSCK